VSTGDTSAHEDKPIVLEAIDFPTPVSSSRSSRRQSPTGKDGHWQPEARPGRPHIPCESRMRKRTDNSLGMGERHLEIIVDRMMREFGWKRMSASRRSRIGAIRSTASEDTRTRGSRADAVSIAGQPAGRADPGQGSSSSTTFRAAHTKESSPLSKRAWWKRLRAVFWPAMRWKTSG